MNKLKRLLFLILPLSTLVGVVSCDSNKANQTTKTKEKPNSKLNSPFPISPPISVSRTPEEHEKFMNQEIDLILREYQQSGFTSAMALYVKETMQLTNLNADTLMKWNNLKLKLYAEDYFYQLTPRNDVLKAIERLSGWASMEKTKQKLSPEFQRTSHWSIQKINDLVDSGSLFQAKQIIRSINELLDKNSDVSLIDKDLILTTLTDQEEKIDNLLSPDNKKIINNVNCIEYLLTQMSLILVDQQAGEEPITPDDVMPKMNKILSILKEIIQYRETFTNNSTLINHNNNIKDSNGSLEILENYFDAYFSKEIGSQNLSSFNKQYQEIIKLQFQTKKTEIYSLINFINSKFDLSYQSNFNVSEIVKSNFLELKELYYLILNSIQDAMTSSSINVQSTENIIKFKNLYLIFKLMREVHKYYIDVYADTKLIDEAEILKNMFDKTKEKINSLINENKKNIVILEKAFPIDYTNNLKGDAFINMIRNIQEIISPSESSFDQPIDDLHLMAHIVFDNPPTFSAVPDTIKDVPIFLKIMYGKNENN